MSMNKVIHGAIRRDLRRFGAALERLQPGDTAMTGRITDAWGHFEKELHEHHTGEHTIAWPALQAIGVSPESISRFDAEHDAMAAALADASVAMATLRRAPSESQIATTRAAVTHLQDVTLTHLDHEEAEVEELYLASEERPEIKAMNREFAKGGPAKGGQLFAWVSDGADPDELATLNSQVPAPVRMIVGGIFGRHYRRHVGSLWAELGLT